MIAEPRARPNAEGFNPPLRDGHVFCNHSQSAAADTGLLSLSPSGTRTIGYWSRVAKPLRVLRGAVEMVRGFV